MPAPANNNIVNGSSNNPVSQPGVNTTSDPQQISSDIDPNILNMLKQFRTPTKFQKEVMKVIINQLNEKDITNL